ncbi:hypothetical protein LCGC14_0678400 [marine sediment metagenome]|uniref:Ribbon-helix-helix protein, CopG family n=2 Tax=root TaxID=1 RepID=A0A9C9TIQ6_9HYPH|nr:ribbon-helix-helix protein, CopG family [Aurantimonas coralicida]
MPRDKQIHIKVDEREAKQIAAAAAKAGKGVSEFLRDLALASSKCTRCRGSGLEPKGGRR